MAESAEPRSIREIQADIDAWIQENGGYWPPLSMLARLTEEAGEVAREYNHRFGSKQKKRSEGGAELGTPAARSELASELGDVLFILLSMANEQGIDMDEALAGVMNKLKVRDAGRFSG